MRRALPALLGVLGMAALAVGIALLTFLALPGRLTAAHGGTAVGAPVIVTAPGVLELGGRGVEVTARGSGPVFLGIARESDVQAWLQSSARLQVTGLRDAATLATRLLPGQPGQALPDPRGSDIWAELSRGASSARLTWPNTLDGRWLLVVASDGAKPAPVSLSLSWARRVRTSAAAVPLVAGGAVAVVAAAVSTASARRRRPAGGGTPG